LLSICKALASICSTEKGKRERERGRKEKRRDGEKEGRKGGREGGREREWKNKRRRGQKKKEEEEVVPSLSIHHLLSGLIRTVGICHFTTKRVLWPSIMSHKTPCW
jgi:hypothetical protein